MEWIFTEDCKPANNTKVWIYIPFRMDGWKLNMPEIIISYYQDDKFYGISENDQKFIKAWIPWIEVYSSVTPRYIRPERSKREDADCFINCTTSMCEFNNLCVECTKKCNPAMRCSEHCGNTVKDK